MAKNFAIGISDFSGGLNTSDSPSLIADNEFPIAQNVEIIGKGKLQKRYGYDVVSSGGSGRIQGLIPFTAVGTTPSKNLIIFNNGNVYMFTPEDTTWVLRGTYTDNGNRVNGAVFNNIVVFGNGGTTVGSYRENLALAMGSTGNVTSIQTSISEAANSKQTIDAGFIPASSEIIAIGINVSIKGTGNWTVTVHDASNNVLATKTLLNAAVVVGENKFYFSEPLIYSATVDHFHITSTVNDGECVSGSVGDYETIDSGVYIRRIVTLSAAPKGSIFCVDNHFLTISGVPESPSVVYWCDTDDPLTWSGGVSGNVVVSVDDGEKVRALVSHNDQFMAIKDFAKHGLDRVFDADELITGYAQKEIVDRSEGTLAGNSAVSTATGIIFLGEDKFQSYGRVENYEGARLPENLSEKIAPTVKSISKANIDKVTAIHDKFNNKYRCSAPVGISSTNNLEFIYDLRFGAFTLNTGLPVADYAVFENSDGKRAIYWGSDLEGKIFKFNQRFSDAYDDSLAGGSGISAIWRSKTFNRFNSSLAFNNEFDRVFIKGAITNPFSGTFSITVFNGTTRTTEFFDITDDDIDGSGSIGGYVGDTYVGIGYIGGGGTPTSDAPLYPFFKEIYFPDTINHGREIYVGFQSDNDLEGFRIDDIIITGKTLSDEIVQ